MTHDAVSPISRTARGHAARLGASALIASFALAFTAPAHATDVFEGCFKNLTSKVRASTIVANATPVCKVTETPRTWNATGPAGPAGPVGPAGSDGFSVYQEIGDARGPVSIPASGVTVASLSLPAGSFVVTASLYFTNDSPDAGIAGCTLLVGDRNAQIYESEAGGQAVGQALTVASTLTSPGSARLLCTNNGSGGNLAIQTFNLNAIQVGTLTFQ